MEMVTELRRDCGLGLLTAARTQGRGLDKANRMLVQGTSLSLGPMEAGLSVVVLGRVSQAGRMARILRGTCWVQNKGQVQGPLPDGAKNHQGQP